MNIEQQFNQAFHEAGGIKVGVYAHSLRFFCVMFLIIGVIWALGNFLSDESKNSEQFMVVMVSRLVRMLIGFVFFLLLVTV